MVMEVAGSRATKHEKLRQDHDEILKHVKLGLETLRPLAPTWIEDDKTSSKFEVYAQTRSDDYILTVANILIGVKKVLKGLGTRCTDVVKPSVFMTTENNTKMETSFFVISNSSVQ